MAYLEQSTRYIPYTERRGDALALPRAGRARRPSAARAVHRDARRGVRDLRALDRSDARVVRARASEGGGRFGRRLSLGDSRQGARHAARPAAGGDAVERRHLRHRARRTRRCCCACARIRSLEVRATADLMLRELRKVIPAFLTRVDQPDRGGRWTRVPGRHARAHGRLAARLGSPAAAARRRPTKSRSPISIRTAKSRSSPPRSIRVFDAPDAELLAAVARDDADASARPCCAPAVGERTNRRHKPGRAFERTSYRFDILTDYGAFRDLQRHRLLTIDWQTLTPRHGYTQPEAIVEAGGDADWREVMDRSAELHEALVGAGLTRRGAVRRLDGVPRPLRHGHERARGDARHRAAHGAGGHPGLPPRVPADAPADRRRRRTPRDRAPPCSSPITRPSSSSGCRKNDGWKRSQTRQRESSPETIDGSPGSSGSTR